MTRGKVGDGGGRPECEGGVGVGGATERQREKEEEERKENKSADSRETSGFCLDGG